MSKNSDIALTIEQLSKRFLVGQNLNRSTLGSVFSKKETFKGMSDTNRIVGDNFWALRDINLEVNRGETLGIIGSNGAGKTTLLKILSGILKQTHGTYTINGRVSSLIGVGTGFHQELTGRENVYFNGALLGMSKLEVRNKFEEIVDFAEISGFIDTPIKYYSSGMRSRLAFSVAMNLDAEIMIIDEALAVGDVAFKEKSSEKMRNTAFTGKTVLFVTHSMAFLREVCENSIILDKGIMAPKGPTDEMIDKYLNKGPTQKVAVTWKKGSDQMGDDTVSFNAIQLFSDGKKLTSKTASLSEKLEVQINFTMKKKSSAYTIGYTLFDEAGRRLWRSSSVNTKLSKGKQSLVSTIDTSLLRPGIYYVALDSELRGAGWVVDPKKTKAKVVVSLSGERLDITDIKKEGVVKPESSWKLV